MNNLALAYQAQGRLDEAVPLFEETLRLRKEKLGPEHPDTLDSDETPLAMAYLMTERVHRPCYCLKNRYSVRKTSWVPSTAKR